MKNKLVYAITVAAFMCASVMAYAGDVQVNVRTQSAGKNQANPQYAGFLSSCTAGVAGFHLISSVSGSSVPTVVSQLMVSTGAAGGTAMFYDHSSPAAVSKRSTQYETHSTSPTFKTFSPGLYFNVGAVLWTSNADRACVLYMKQ